MKKADKRALARAVLEQAKQIKVEDGDNVIAGLQRIAQSSPDVQARLKALRLLAYELQKDMPPAPSPLTKWNVVRVKPEGFDEWLKEREERHPPKGYG